MQPAVRAKPSRVGIFAHFDPHAADDLKSVLAEIWLNGQPGPSADRERLAAVETRRRRETFAASFTRIMTRIANPLELEAPAVSSAAQRGPVAPPLTT